jgi:hypothetical protein
MPPQTYIRNGWRDRKRQFTRLSRIALGLHVLIVLADRAHFGRVAQTVRGCASWIYPFIGRASRRGPRGVCVGCSAKFESALGAFHQILAGGFGLPAGDLFVQTLHGRREDITLFPRAAIVRGGPRALGRGLAAQLPALARGNIRSFPITAGIASPSTNVRSPRFQKTSLKCGA